MKLISSGPRPKFSSVVFSALSAGDSFSWLPASFSAWLNVSCLRCMKCMSHANLCGFHLAFEYADQHPLFSSRTCRKETKRIAFPPFEPMPDASQASIAGKTAHPCKVGCGLTAVKRRHGTSVSDHQGSYVRTYRLYRLYYYYTSLCIHIHTVIHIITKWLTLKNATSEKDANILPTPCCAAGEEILIPAPLMSPACSSMCLFAARNARFASNRRRWLIAKWIRLVKLNMLEFSLVRTWADWGTNANSCAQSEAIPNFVQLNLGDSFFWVGSWNPGSTKSWRLFGITMYHALAVDIMDAPIPCMSVNRSMSEMGACGSSEASSTVVSWPAAWDGTMEDDGRCMQGKRPKTAKSKRPGRLESQRLQGNCVPVWNLRQAFKSQKTQLKQFVHASNSLKGVRPWLNETQKLDTVEWVWGMHGNLSIFTFLHELWGTETRSRE